MRTVLVWAARRKYIAAAPYIERPQKPAPKDLYLTRDQADRLIAGAAAPHVRLAIVIMLTTAARAEAVLGLTWDQVVFERGLIDLRNPFETKRRKGRAVVPMNVTLTDALREARSAAVSPFVVEYGGGRVKSVKRGLKTAASRAGLDPATVSPHVLRHTAAVLMAEAGIRMSEIGRISVTETAP